MLLAAKSASTGQIQLCVTSCVLNSSHINVLSFNVLHVIVTSDEFLTKIFSAYTRLQQQCKSIHSAMQKGTYRDIICALLQGD